MDNNTALARPPAQREPADAVKPELREVYLHPGQNHVEFGPVLLKMILGSCVGVFLFDPILRIGGATHFMLPAHRAGQPSPRYGDVAIARLLEAIRALGCRNQNIRAKVFGGASMLRSLKNLDRSQGGQIGRRNTESAIEVLGREAIPIVEKDVLGNRARKVAMVSNTGEVTLDVLS